ncbi:hypothetical protein [Nocardia brasiliensis]|uniref:hypothetical protein n=1 Tax=Nocardia brasiliensis TaxID=37326 RepID=UPI0024578019|nr:hypothetical protein [Nocardia brasiliensis]
MGVVPWDQTQRTAYQRKPRGMSESRVRGRGKARSASKHGGLPPQAVAAIVQLAQLYNNSQSIRGATDPGAVFPSVSQSRFAQLFAALALLNAVGGLDSLSGDNIQRTIEQIPRLPRLDAVEFTSWIREQRRNLPQDHTISAAAPSTDSVPRTVLTDIVDSAADLYERVASFPPAGWPLASADAHPLPGYDAVVDTSVMGESSHDAPSRRPRSLEESRAQRGPQQPPAHESSLQKTIDTTGEKYLHENIRKVYRELTGGDINADISLSRRAVTVSHSVRDMRWTHRTYRKTKYYTVAELFSGVPQRDGFDPGKPGCEVSIGKVRLDPVYFSEKFFADFRDRLNTRLRGDIGEVLKDPEVKAAGFELSQVLLDAAALSVMASTTDPQVRGLLQDYLKGTVKPRGINLDHRPVAHVVALSRDEESGILLSLLTFQTHPWGAHLKSKGLDSFLRPHLSRQWNEKLLGPEDFQYFEWQGAYGSMHKIYTRDAITLDKGDWRVHSWKATGHMLRQNVDRAVYTPHEQETETSAMKAKIVLRGTAAFTFPLVVGATGGSGAAGAAAALLHLGSGAGDTYLSKVLADNADQGHMMRQHRDELAAGIMWSLVGLPLDGAGLLPPAVRTFAKVHNKALVALLKLPANSRLRPFAEILRKAANTVAAKKFFTTGNAASQIDVDDYLQGTRREITATADLLSIPEGERVVVRVTGAGGEMNDVAAINLGGGEIGTFDTVGAKATLVKCNLAGEVTFTAGTGTLADGTTIRIITNRIAALPAKVSNTAVKLLKPRRQAARSATQLAKNPPAVESSPHASDSAAGGVLTILESSGAITAQQSAHLRQAAMAGRFTELLGKSGVIGDGPGFAKQAVTIGELYRIPPGYMVGFIVNRQGRDEMVHLMISTGKGKFVGQRNDNLHAGMSRGWATYRADQMGLEHDAKGFKLADGTSVNILVETKVKEFRPDIVRIDPPPLSTQEKSVAAFRAKSMKDALAERPEIQPLLKAPKENCEKILTHVLKYLREEQFENIRVRGMAIWDDPELVKDSTHMNHYVVLGDHADNTYVFDLTAGQFASPRWRPGFNGPVVTTEEEWVNLYRKEMSKRLIKYRDFALKSDATGMFDPLLGILPNEHIPGALRLNTPPWYRGEAEALVDTVDTLIDRLRERSQVRTALLPTHYTKSEVIKIVTEGQHLGLDVDMIEDLLEVGSNKMKPISTTQLLEQMRNWKRVESRNFPYKFDSLEQFRTFSDDAIAEIDAAGFPADAVYIQGSALRNPGAHDVDLTVFVSRTDFDDTVRTHFGNRLKLDGKTVPIIDLDHAGLIDLAKAIQQEYKIYTWMRRRSEYAPKYNDQARSFAEVMLSGHYNSQGTLSPKLAAAVRALSSKYKSQNIESITVAVRGSDIDTRPNQLLHLQRHVDTSLRNQAGSTRLAEQEIQFYDPESMIMTLAFSRHVDRPLKELYSVMVDDFAGACGDTAELLKQLTFDSGIDGPIVQRTGNSLEDFLSEIRKTGDANIKVWSNAHAFFVEKRGDACRIYQSYMGRYTLADWLTREFPIGSPTSTISTNELASTMEAIGNKRRNEPLANVLPEEERFFGGPMFNSNDVAGEKINLRFESTSRILSGPEQQSQIQQKKAVNAEAWNEIRTSNETPKQWLARKYPGWESRRKRSAQAGADWPWKSPKPL